MSANASSDDVSNGVLTMTKAGLLAQSQDINITVLGESYENLDYYVISIHVIDCDIKIEQVPYLVNRAALSEFQQQLYRVTDHPVGADCGPI